MKDVKKLEKFVQECWPETIEDKYYGIYFDRATALGVLKESSWNWFNIHIRRMWEFMRGVVNKENPEEGEEDVEMG